MSPLVLQTLFWSAHNAFSNVPTGAIAPETGQCTLRAVKDNEVSNSMNVARELESKCESSNWPVRRANSSIDQNAHESKVGDT